MKLIDLKKEIDFLLEMYDEDTEVKLKSHKLKTPSFELSMNDGDDHIEIYPLMGG